MTGRFGKAVWPAAALLLVLVQIPSLARTAADSDQSDFANYFVPAQVLARDGNLGALYDRDAFDLALRQSGFSGLGSFIPHPPANALWLWPLASQPREKAKAYWSAVLVASLALTGIALANLRAGIEPWTAAILVLAPTLAIRNGLAFGQPYFILSALLAWGVVALEKGRGFLGGVLLGLGVSFKPYALGLGLLLANRGSRRAFAGFACGVVGPSALLWALCGPEPFAAFFSRVLPWMVRGDIQDPFSPGWGSVVALANRVFRFEADLNPHPWFDAPVFARFLGSSLSVALSAVGVLAGRRAFLSGRTLDGIGIYVAFALSASPFAASYHLVLLTISLAALAARHRGRAQVFILAGWALLGSSALYFFRSAEGAFAPLAYLRFFGLAALALAVSRPFLNRKILGAVLGVGVCAGAFRARLQSGEVIGTRIDEARGYSMMKPYFCGSDLRWMSPSPDGRRLESRGAGSDCRSSAGVVEPPPSGPTLVAHFREGSWNLYLTPARGGEETRQTFSFANEVDPVLTPDGCAVVFASDQGRGLGSTALYRLDLSRSIEGCAGPGPAAGPR